MAYRQGEATRVNRVIAKAGQIVCVTKPFRVEVKSKFDPNCDENYKLENRFYRTALMLFRRLKKRGDYSVIAAVFLLEIAETAPDK